MYKRLSLVAFFALFTMCLCAQQITESKARNIASSFYGFGSKLTLVLTGGEKTAPDYYIFNVGDNQGYVIIAGDESMPDIIPVYSDSGMFDKENIPSIFQAILDGYSQSVKATRKSVEKKGVKKTRSISPKATTQVGPLLGNIEWGQEDPYNLQCPGKLLTGCGATAAAQIMKYHQWPLNGTGGIYRPWGSTYEIDYSKATYDWSLMLPNYYGTPTDAQKDEVAKLMHHIGFSINMNYSTNGSGSDLKNMPGPFAKYFSYSTNTKTAYRFTYTDSEWLSMIKKEIDNKRPILYSGKDIESYGHLFVCDGYDSSNKIHMNFGWNGYLNAYYALSAITYTVNNAAMIGFYPNNQTVADADQAAPQVAQLSSINCSTHSPAVGEAFNIAIRVANHNSVAFNGNIGVALFKGNTMQGTPIKQQSVSLAGTSNQGFVENDVQLNSMAIPTGTADGNYKLRLITQQGSIWYPMLYIIADVTKEINVTIKNGVATFSYPLNSAGSNLELTKPIDVTVASNFARVRFSVINKDEFFACENTDVYVMAHSDVNLMPTVWAKVTINELSSGLVKDFEINDLPVPPGANVKSCRFYVAYSRPCAQPIKGREVSADPMLPFSYNFSNYKIPAETTVKHVVFLGTGAAAIPADYKKYNDVGVEDGKVWVRDVMSGYATGGKVGAKLVTSAFNIDDENYVLEWKMNNMYGDSYRYVLYISTDGQDFSNFVTPVYDKELNVNINSPVVARVSLAEYVGKKVYLAFESTATGSAGLSYFKILNIKTPKDIVINSLNVPGTVIIGESIKIGASIKNNSALNVKKIIATYIIAGNKVEEIIDTDIPFSESKEVEFKKLATLTGSAGDKIPIVVDMRVEGEDTSLLGNNTMTANTFLSNFSPRKKMLVYKMTKKGCYGCQLDYAALDHFDDYYPEYCTGVEIWRDGSFATKDFPGYMVGSTPSYFMNAQWSAKNDAYNNAPNFIQKIVTPADISATAEYEDEKSRVLNITLKANFAMPMTGKYKMGAIIIENNVKNIDGEITGTYPSGDKLIKNHIPIGVIAVNDAPAGSVIENPLAQEYTYDCTFTVPAELTYKYRKDNIIVVAVLYGPNGEILNCSQDSYYIKLRQTDGLTFVPVDSHPTFKDIYDIESPNETLYKSIANSRATVPAGSIYQFRVRKDNSWNGFKPKLIVNKQAKSNRDEQMILTPDEFGVYTISNIHQNYTIEFEREETVDTRSYRIKYNDEILNDGDEVEIRKINIIGKKYYMRFQPEVTNTSGVSFPMRMTKETIAERDSTVNYLCWDSCMTPDDASATSASIASWETQNPYGELWMLRPRIGMTTVKYTFMTSFKGDPTVSVTVCYKNDTISGVDNIDQDEELTITTRDGILEIKSSGNRVLNLYDISGRLIRIIQVTEGVNIIDDLSRGVYLIDNEKIIL